MPSLSQRKLSEDPVFANLMGGDRLPVLRTPQDEPDASKRNGTASLKTLAAALEPLLTAVGQQVDLLDLTGAQMDQVIAFAYTNGDAPLADTPAWSKPGMWFDAILPNGSTYRYTCGRGNYTPGVAGSGVGPRWSRAAKL